MPVPRTLAVSLLVCVMAGCAPTADVGPASAVPTPRQDPVVQEVTVPPSMDSLLEDALASVALSGEARFSVAVQGLADGSRGGYADEKAYDTASIVKVDILLALLLKAQDEGRALSGQERALAHAMITSSDNAAASALWDVIGGAEGLDAANARLGLTGTSAGADGRWGLTRTTAADQLVLLEAVFGDARVVSAASQAYVQELLGAIVEGQDWGVSAAGGDSALKNGWLPRSTTGLWDINSIGRVRLDGREYLIAVLSDGHGTKEDGVALVERVARAAAAVVTGGAGS
ncbi:serine hydrolase [Streptomyces mesophilus]|uniref:serine hydrolase n=1 Tax=Streptomyces mesophilus TaxID=1775132 RepID=UPI0033318E66